VGTIATFFWLIFVVLGLATGVLFWLGIKRPSEKFIDLGSLCSGLAMGASGFGLLLMNGNLGTQLGAAGMIFIGGCNFGMSLYKLTRNAFEQTTGQPTSKRPG
jgi:hypothetical protein